MLIGEIGLLLLVLEVPLGPCSSPMPRTIYCSYGGVLFLLSEVPLYGDSLPLPGVSAFRSLACEGLLPRRAMREQSRH